jgi:hypothetical protein
MSRPAERTRRRRADESLVQHDIDSVRLGDDNGNTNSNRQAGQPEPTWKIGMEHATYSLQPIGIVRSSLREVGDAPNQAFEGAPEALLEIDPAYARALHRVTPGRTSSCSRGFTWPIGASSRLIREETRTPF